MLLAVVVGRVRRVRLLVQLAPSRLLDHLTTLLYYAA